MQHESVKLIDIDILSAKVGGRFQFTSLVAKRLRAVNAGAPFLVEPEPGERAIETICREIEEGKVWLERATPAETEVATVEAEDIDELLDMD